MARDVTIIGFGEAAQTFCGADGWRGRARAFDILTGDPATRAEMRAAYDQAGVTGFDSLGEALCDARLVLNLVTADQAAAAARACAPHLSPGALFCDLTSVAPDTKKASAAALAEAGARYGDVAIMSPVIPAALNAPLLISGPDAGEAESALAALGFADTRVVGDAIGRASAIKMIRSVMIKGVEALTAECLLAADAAGVVDEVLGSLGEDWPTRADYHLDRMLVHGARRAAEMEEVAKTLDGLGVEPQMARATVTRQARLAALGAPAADGLPAKLAAIRGSDGGKTS